MTKLTDRELKVRGFMVLVQTFGDVDAERFIALTNRDPMDYTRWREKNLYVGESVHDVAKRARAAAARYSVSFDIATGDLIVGELPLREMRLVQG